MRLRAVGHERVVGKLKQLGCRDDTIRCCIGARGVGLPGQTAQQCGRKWGMPARKRIIARVVAPRRHVERLLFMRGRRQCLPGLTLQKALILRGVQRLGIPRHVTCGGPAKRAGKAAVQNDQQVTAGHGLQRRANGHHRDPRISVAGPGILRQQKPLRALGTVAARNAVSGKVEQEGPFAVGQMRGKRLKLRGNGLRARLLIQQRRNRVAVLFTQHLGNSACISHGAAQRRDTTVIGVDAHDQRSALGQFTHRPCGY